MRKKIWIVVMAMFVNYTFAQRNVEKKPVERKGFVIGLGVGGGSLTLKKNDTTSTVLSPTLPNIKIGFMVNNRLALLALFPGAVYKYKGSDRGFEAFQIAAQYWIKDRWWVLGGTGLTFDASAFYTVSDPKKAEFYTGLPSFSLGTGYEVWRKGRFAIDFQYRLFYGISNLPRNDNRIGVSNMLIVGINWY